MQPGTIINVDESEYLDLDRQGLVLEVVTVPMEEILASGSVRVVSSRKKPEEA
jgi:hypothetical protein